MANLDRRGNFEERILAREFNVLYCSACEKRFLVERTVGLVSFEQRRWIICYPLSCEKHWRDLGRAALTQFHRNRCAMPLWLRTAPSSWAIRVLFGHDQLREKFVIWRSGLDELAVEAAKIALMAADPRRYGARIWLVDVVGDELRWVFAHVPGQAQRLTTTRAALEVSFPDGLLAEELLADCYVNARRWTVRPVGADPLEFDLEGIGYVEGGGAVLRRPVIVTTDESSS